MLKPVLITAPAEEPVDLALAKQHCNVTHADHDALLQGYLLAATHHLDGHSGILGRCMVEQTWRQDFAHWPPTPKLRLPFPKVLSVTSLKYSDLNDAEQTVSSSLYVLHHDAEGAFLWLKSDFTGPSFNDDRPDPIRCTFVAGYGAAAAVPTPIKHAILLLVGHWYENREAVVIGSGLQINDLPMGVKSLLFNYISGAK